MKLAIKLEMSLSLSHSFSRKRSNNHLIVQKLWLKLQMSFVGAVIEKAN